MILVTGGTGLVGSALNFKEEHILLSSKDGDLRDWEQTKAIFEKYQPTKVVHCAAKVGGLGSNMSLKGDFYRDNIRMNTNVLDASLEYGVDKVVSFLSTCVFPADVTYPLDEKKIHLGPPHHSNYPYAYVKRMLDIQSRAYREQYGCNFVSVVPVNIYGEHDNFSLEHSHVVPALIHKCFMAKKNSEPFVVWGSGTPLREFIYVKDIARLTEWALENYEDPEPIIFTTAQETSIKDLANMVARLMDFKGPVIFDDTKPDGQYRKPSSNEKLMQAYPSFTFTTLEHGMEQTISWFVKNYESARL